MLGDAIASYINETYNVNYLTGPKSVGYQTIMQGGYELENPVPIRDAWVQGFSKMDETAFDPPPSLWKTMLGFPPEIHD